MDVCTMPSGKEMFDCACGGPVQWLRSTVAVLASKKRLSAGYVSRGKCDEVQGGDKIARGQS